MPLYKNVSESTYYKGGSAGRTKPGETVKFENGPPESFEDEFELVDASDAAESDSPPNPTESSDGEEESPESGNEPPQNEAEGDSSPSVPDPRELTVAQLESELAAGDFSPEEVETMLEMENSSEDPRVTAIEALEEVM